MRVTLATTANGKRLNLGPSGDNIEMIVRDSRACGEGAKRGWLEVSMGEDIWGLDHRTMQSGLKARVLVARGDRVETAGRVQEETVNLLKGMDIPEVKYRVLEPATNPDGEDDGYLLPLEAPRAVAEELLALPDDILEKSV